MTEEGKKEVKYTPHKCVVCNGFGTLKYGQINCQACGGKGFIVLNNETGDVVEREKEGKQNED